MYGPVVHGPDEGDSATSEKSTTRSEGWLLYASSMMKYWPVQSGPAFFISDTVLEILSLILRGGQ